jgi:hypothetical protein
MRWTEFNKPFSDFVKAGKNIPGALIEVEMRGRRKVFLIGDVNTSGVSSTGGKPFSNKAIVLHYKYIWGHWEPTKHSYDSHTA